MNSSGPVYKVHDSSIQYYDGSEQRLLDIISSPDFDEYTTWQKQRDWATYYHLSPLRKNLLNWMELGPDPVEILELGAGCGAVTAGLVEFSNARVTALEGSPHRAEVIRARCKTASNLEIHACDINAFEPERKFDLVTLIGVLEYAGRYGKEAEPFQWLLNRVGQWLKDDGSLVVAIENKLGHKYLAGCQEDHYSQPYEGINGYPNYTGIATFSSSDLRSMLAKAGLSHQHWFYPYPDYKLPSVVLSEAALNTKGFDPLGLLRVEPEPNFNKNPTFNERPFLRDLCNIGTCGPFMNSFLVFASKIEQSGFSRHNANVLAVRANNKRRSKKFYVTTLFKAEKSATITVIKKGGHDYSTNIIRRTAAPLQREYKQGMVNFQDALIDAFTAGRELLIRTAIDQWTALMESKRVQPSAEEITRYETFSTGAFGRVLYKGCKEWIGGEAFDLIPQNILVDPNADILEPADLEWAMAFPLPQQLVFDRGWAALQQEITKLRPFWRKDLHPDTGLPVDIHGILMRAPLFCQMNREEGALVDAWFREGLKRGRFEGLRIEFSTKQTNSANDEERPQDVSGFLRRVTNLAQADPKAAVGFYKRYRSQFGQSPELAQFDSLMQKLMGAQ